MTTSELSYRDHDGVTHVVEGCTLTVDKIERHYIWSEQLQHNLVYKTKGRENALIAAIDSLLFTISLRDERIAALQRVATLAEKFADEIKPDEPHHEGFGVMNKLGIKFGDNDFYATIVPFLEQLQKNSDWIKLKDKEKLAFVINESLFAFYVTRQNLCSYNGLEKLDEEYIKHMKDYLTVSPKNILLDKEIAAYLTQNDGWCNGEFFVITDQSSGVSVY